MAGDRVSEVLPDDREGYLERYAQLRFALTPVRGKKAFWDDWPNQFVTGLDRIKQVFLKQYPTVNIGLVLEPSHLIALDVDKKYGGLATLEQLEFEHGFQDTLRCATGGGGQRLFYRSPDFPVKRDPDFAPGIELLGAGSQAVLPPSIHPETRALYAWDMMDDELDWEHIKIVPEWLMQKLVAGNKPKKVQVAERPTDKVAKGGRHSIMVSMAGVMRERMAASQTEIEAYLQVFNESRCDPPYDREHVAKIAETVSLYAPSDPLLVERNSKAYALALEYKRRDEKFREEYKPITATELQRGNFVAPTVVVHEMFVVGLSLIAGLPKVGKSWLTIQTAISISTGSPLFGCQPIHRPGRVSYVSLEEDEAQTTEKLDTLNPDKNPLNDIDLYYKCPKLLEGGEDILASIIEKSRPSVMIIDSYKAISTEKGPKDIVVKEYASVKVLADLAKSTGTAILMICHSPRILPGTGITYKIAGTYGNTAAADTISALYADGDSFVFEGEGRSIKGFRFVVLKRFSEGIGWQVKSKGEDARYSDRREQIFNLLVDTRRQGPMTPRRIATELSMNGATVRSLLKRMVNAGQIHRTEDDTYVPLGDALYDNVIPFKPRDK